MLKFLIQFIAHIDETKRPKEVDFKKEYHINYMMQFENMDQMAKFVNDTYKSLIHDPGLTVFKDGGYDAGVTGPANIERRMFVPWAMFSHFEAKIKPILEPEDTKPQLVESHLLIEPKKDSVN